MTSEPLSTPPSERRGARDWSAVETALAARRDQLDPAGLTLLGEATWWLGNAPGAMKVAEEAFQRLVVAGEDHEAADHALRLSLAWLLRGDVAISRAWLSRSRRLVAALPPGVLHGYLAYVEGTQQTDLTGDPEPCRTAAAELDRLTERFGDPALRTLAMALHGIAGVRSGDPVTGWAALEESILPLLNGCVEPMWTGDLLCSVVHLCDELDDLARAQEWTGVMARWSTPLSRTFMYADVVRVHELALAAAAGEWDLVEAELGSRTDNLVGAHGWLAGEGYYLLGEIRRLRGDPEGAEASYRRARALEHDAQPGTALLLRAAGQVGEAIESLRIARADHPPLRRARLLLPMVEVLLQAGDREYAERLATELERTAEHFGSPGLRALACRARAGVLLGSEQAGSALVLLEEAGAIYRDQRHRYAAAQVHESLGLALSMQGDQAGSAAEVATAAAIYRGPRGRAQVASSARCAGPHRAPSVGSMTTQHTYTQHEGQTTDERLLEIWDHGSTCVLASIGHELGLFDTLADLPPATSAQIADAAGLDERYVREWLGGMTTSRFVDYEPADATYRLNADAAPYLVVSGPDNVARMMRYVAMMGAAAPKVAEAFRTGGGLAYEDYEQFHDIQGEDSAAVHDASLLDATLPLTGLTDRLRGGIRVVDVGCGQGHAVNLMARAFPASRFVGWDFSDEALTAARAEASDWGLTNAEFVIRDVATLPEGDVAAFDLVTAFDAIHDQTRPATVLANVHRALRPGGTFLMVDMNAQSNLEGNLDLPWATFLYAVSTIHCMSVSLGQGGAGLGAVWGVQTAERMLREAGFAEVERHDVEADPFNAYFVAHRD